jgi:hypothetical protein
MRGTGLKILNDLKAPGAITPPVNDRRTVQQSKGQPLIASTAHGDRRFIRAALALDISRQSALQKTAKIVGPSEIGDLYGRV